MAQRRFGPTRGAGVAVIELEGEKSIEPAALGMAGYAGMFEKGPVGELVIVTNKRQFTKKMGGIIPDSLAPDCCHDYFDLAGGAGGLLLVRITDGNEEKATATLYARFGSLLTPMGTLRAKNGGRWGGKQRRHTANLAAAGDLTNITLTTGITTFKADEWKGGFVELDAVANKRYPIVGNTAAGVVTVAADQKMKDDWTAAAAPTNLRYYLVLDADRDKAVSYLIGDGEELPDAEFSLTVYVDGAVVNKYPNLSTDPVNKRYWVNVINNDGGNDEVEAVDLWTGAHVPAVRPSNHHGKIAAVTTTTMTAVIHDKTNNSAAGSGGTFTLGATTDADVAQKITLTVSTVAVGVPTALTAVSDKFGALGMVTPGTLFDPHNAAGGANKNKWVPPFTIAADFAITWLVAETVVINYKPFAAGTLVEGFLYPDKVNAKREKYRITANTHKVITVADGSDLTASGAVNDDFLVEARLGLEKGRDGNSAVVDATFNQKAWDTGTSPYNRVVGKNLGLVKFATPGITSTSVQKAGAAYAQAKNHQYRYEIPNTVVTEDAAIAQINDTLGRTEYAVVAFPSYGSITDPLGGGEGKLKSVPLTGMIHGREARIAADFDGYHKAQAGVEAILPKLLKIPTGDAILNEELLNPVGIAVIKKAKGNFIIWGDRTVHVDPTWKWKHQREQMSHYEHVLQENFDFIVFAINDPVTEKLALAALKSFFFPEFVKRALRGATFEEAAVIKIDAENNTNATRAAGDMFADIALRLADTVERFIIRIGKQGVFESVG